MTRNTESPAETSASMDNNDLEEDSGYIVRVSLLSVLEDKQRTLNRRSFVNSLIYIAKLAPGVTDGQLIGKYYEKKLRSLKKHRHNEEITGFLLIYPTYIVHMLESSAEILYDVMHDVNDISSKADDALLADPKIINISHNIANRITQNWSFRILSNVSISSDSSNAGTVQRATENFLSMFINLVHFIVINPKLNVKNAVENLQDVIPDLLIPQPVIAHLHRHDEILSCEQYLKNLTECKDFVLDTEQVWPMKIDVLKTL